MCKFEHISRVFFPPSFSRGVARAWWYIHENYMCAFALYHQADQISVSIFCSHNEYCEMQYDGFVSCIESCVFVSLWGTTTTLTIKIIELNSLRTIKCINIYVCVRVNVCCLFIKSMKKPIHFKIQILRVKCIYIWWSIFVVVRSTKYVCACLWLLYEIRECIQRVPSVIRPNGNEHQNRISNHHV